MSNKPNSDYICVDITDIHSGEQYHAYLIYADGRVVEVEEVWSERRGGQYETAYTHSHIDDYSPNTWIHHHWRRLQAKRHHRQWQGQQAAT